MQTEITPDRRRELAEKYSINEQYLYQCLTGRRDLNPAVAMRLESETKGELTRQALCQKTFAGIWPDLQPRVGNAERRIGPADRRTSKAA